MTNPCLDAAQTAELLVTSLLPFGYETSNTLDVSGERKNENAPLTSHLRIPPSTASHTTPCL